MTIFGHALLFLLSAGVIWFFAGILVDSIDKVAKRFNQHGFTIAFFVLGLLTSIGEISVMVNATIQQAPQVSAGNLAGASFVILLFIVPLLAILGNGVKLRNTLHRWHLATAFFIITLPNLFMLDGTVTRNEGTVSLLAYGSLVYFIQKHARSRAVPNVIEKVEHELVHKKRATAWDAAKIALGGLFIFIAANLLVQEAVFLSGALGIPASIIGLVILSIATNVPELVIAIRAILKKRKDIAFGDYLGSSLYNTPTFGLLALLNGKFQVEASEFIFTSLLLCAGLVAFYHFAGSKDDISKREGLLLVAFYALFLLVQLLNMLRFATS